MNSSDGNCRRMLAVLGALLVAPQALALPDHLTVVTTNPNTNAQVTLELERYNPRAPNWQCRVYSSPTSYTVLPAGQVPEPTTYRGRTSDGGMVWSAVRPTNLTMYTRVNYGTRWAGAGNSDPYESASRYAWTKDIQLTGQTVNNGYVYQAAANSLVPVPTDQLPPANWYNNLGAANNFGGPPPVQQPVEDARQPGPARLQRQPDVVGRNLSEQHRPGAGGHGKRGERKRCDVRARRRGGLPDRGRGRPDLSGRRCRHLGQLGDLSGQFDIMCWVGNWGVSDGSFIISYPADMGADTWVHELGHSLGGPDFPHEHDYQGGLWDTCHEVPDLR